MLNVSDSFLVRKKVAIEIISNELKNIAQMEYSRHHCIHNFTANQLSAIAAYVFLKYHLVIYQKDRLSFYAI